MNGTQPLQNLGEILNGIEINPEPIPDLHQRYTTTQTEHATIIHPMKINGYHKVVFCLARSKQVLHRDVIASQCSIPLAQVSCYLQKLKSGNIVISPDWGYYTLSGNFLKAFQLTFGAGKTERLLKMFDEASVDISEFNLSPEDFVKPETMNQCEDEDQLTEVLRKLIDRKRERLNVLVAKLQELQTEMDSVQSEKTKLETELEPLTLLVLNHSVVV